MRDKAKRISAAAAQRALAIRAMFAPASASASEETETHIFDATLSLTGNCATNAVDTVADPGRRCPGVAGVDHPKQRFKVPRSPAIDSYGDIYVASKPCCEDSEALIDVFGSSGNFITEIADGTGAGELAVDSEGHLYVNRDSTQLIEGEYHHFNGVVRYDPTVYEPEAGNIEYGTPPTTIIGGGKIGTGGSSGASGAIALDPSDDHLYFDDAYGVRIHEDTEPETTGQVREYGSAVEGNPLIDDTIGVRGFARSWSIAVDGASHDIYVGSVAGTTYATPENGPMLIKVFDGEDPEHPLIRTIDGSCLPEGQFESDSAFTATIAIDESNGHVFVDNRSSNDFSARFVYEFTETGECVSTIEHSFEYAFRSSIAIDNGAHSPNGALNPDGRYLFVPSGQSGPEPPLRVRPGPESARRPEVESTSSGNVGEAEAELRAMVDPKSTATALLLPIHHPGELSKQKASPARSRGAKAICRSTTRDTRRGHDRRPLARNGLPLSGSWRRTSARPKAARGKPKRRSQPTPRVSRRAAVPTPPFAAAPPPRCPTAAPMSS